MTVLHATSRAEQLQKKKRCKQELVVRHSRPDPLPLDPQALQIFKKRCKACAALHFSSGEILSTRPAPMTAISVRTDCKSTATIPFQSDALRCVACSPLSACMAFLRFFDLPGASGCGGRWGAVHCASPGCSCLGWKACHRTHTRLSHHTYTTLMYEALASIAYPDKHAFMLREQQRGRRHTLMCDPCYSVH